jgi:hypothetical protein
VTVLLWHSTDKSVHSPEIACFRCLDTDDSTLRFEEMLEMTSQLEESCDLSLSQDVISG